MDFLKEHSIPRVRLARAALLTTSEALEEVDSLSALRTAYAKRRGVIWLHWDVSFVGLERGSTEARGLNDADFLTKFLTEVFEPEEGDHVSQIIKWRLNIVGSGAFGGIHEFAAEDEPICMFDAEVFDAAYVFPSKIEGEEIGKLLEEMWRRVLLNSHVIAGIAVPSLVVTVCSDVEPVFFDEEVRDVGEEDEADSPVPSSWRWSDATVVKALKRWSNASSPEFESGDLLAALARECAESYEEVRSWLMAQAEEVEVARLVPDLAGAEVDRLALARRHHWLLQQASRIRAGLDWSHDGREVPEELFSEVRTRAATEERRRELLAALTAVRATLRSALDLVSTATTAEQLELSRQEAARSSAVQGAITFVTTVLLAPGLIAAFFGAMPSILEDEPGVRFGLIAISMAIAAGASWLVLRRITSHSTSSQPDDTTLI